MEKRSNTKNEEEQNGTLEKLNWAQPDFEIHSCTQLPLWQTVI